MEYLISGSMQNKKQTHTVMKLDTVPYLGSTVEGRLGVRAKDGDKGWRDREREVKRNLTYSIYINTFIFGAKTNMFKNWTHEFNISTIQ